MATSLDLHNYTHKIDGVPVTPEQQLAKGNQVRTLGIVALCFVVLGLIPNLGFLFVVVSLVLSRVALKISRENFVSSDYERPAHWASIISTILLVLSAVGLLLMILG